MTWSVKSVMDFVKLLIVLEALGPQLVVVWAMALMLDKLKQNLFSAIKIESFFALFGYVRFT